MNEQNNEQKPKRTPWGDAKAIVQRGNRDVWVTLGPVWETESGSLQFTLDAEPMAWRNPAVERRIVISRRSK